MVVVGSAGAMQDPIAWPAGRTYVPDGRVVRHYILRRHGRSVTTARSSARPAGPSALCCFAHFLPRPITGRLGVGIIAIRWRLAAPLNKRCGPIPFLFLSPTASCAPWGTDKPVHVLRTNCIHIHNVRMYMLHAGKYTYLCYFNTTSALHAPVGYR